METRRIWNEHMFIAAQRAWNASAADGIDDETRRALQRLSATYFFGAMGMSRQEGAGRAVGGDPARPAAEGVATQRRA